MRIAPLSRKGIRLSLAVFLLVSIGGPSMPTAVVWAAGPLAQAVGKPGAEATQPPTPTSNGDPIEGTWATGEFAVMVGLSIQITAAGPGRYIGTALNPPPDVAACQKGPVWNITAAGSSYTGKMSVSTMTWEEVQGKRTRNLGCNTGDFGIGDMFNNATATWTLSANLATMEHCLTFADKQRACGTLTRTSPLPSRAAAAPSSNPAAPTAPAPSKETATPVDPRAMGGGKEQQEYFRDEVPFLEMLSGVNALAVKRQFDSLWDCGYQDSPTYRNGDIAKGPLGDIPCDDADRSSGRRRLVQDALYPQRGFDLDRERQLLQGRNAWVAEQAARLADAVGPGANGQKKLLFPQIEASLPVLLKLAYRGAKAAADPKGLDQAIKNTTAGERFLALLISQDLEMRKEAQP